MKLIEHLAFSPRANVPHCGKFDDLRVTRELHELALRAEIVFADNLVNAFTVHGRELVGSAESAASYLKTLPSIKLPFPEMLIEHEAHAGSDGSDIPGSMRVGTILRYTPDGQSIEMVFVLSVDGLDGFLPENAWRYGAFFQVTGFRVDVQTMSVSRFLPFGEHDEHDINPDASLEYGELPFVCFVLSVMNCRNIQTVRETPNRSTRRAFERKTGRRDIKYHLVTIDRSKNRPAPRLLDGQSLSGTTKHLAPLHICRGHFKNFTAEKPLLGQHVGTYWWEAHTRGGIDGGAVLKDYEVVSEMVQ